MPNTVHVVGATSKIVTLRAIVISTSLPYTAGVFNTSGISAAYCKDGGAPVAITLVTMTQGTWVSSGFVHRHKGVYELGAPNAAFSTIVDGVQFAIDGITDVLFEVIRVELVGTDPRSAAAPDVNVVSGMAAALLDLADAVEIGLTVRGLLRLVGAAAAGKASGMGTVTGVLRNAVADTKPRITATIDSDGNRTAVTTDVT